MESINEGIARGMHSTAPSSAPVGPPQAKDCMATKLVTFNEEQTVREVIQILLSKRISGGPVLGERGRLMGMVSEMDCLRAIAAGAYDNSPFARGRTVREVMTRECITVDPTADIYKMTQLFDQHRVRRLPVVEGERVVGQVSRRDVLSAVERTY